MVGLIGQLLVSALLLWLICKKRLLVLGIAPTKERLTWLFIGFLIAAAVYISYHILVRLLTTTDWLWNPKATSSSVVTSSWWTLKSVLFEELLFRGACCKSPFKSWERELLV
jgi:hypothetical protein